MARIGFPSNEEAIVGPIHGPVIRTQAKGPHHTNRPDRKQGRWLAWRNSETEKDLEKLTLQIPLEANRAEFDEIVHGELYRRLGREPFSQEREAIQALIPLLRGQFRPLFGMLAAAAVAEASVPATNAGHLSC